ncbi:helix-turn-helix domain-containing protein [Chitinibacter sp. FCG-7]|uniref:Helix-turn-helix domain-containing protein n=1 Tax=Chitinibacter mangrovi TaxID=3153927 RepID=A0AAU7F8P2_9NEIS
MDIQDFQKKSPNIQKIILEKLSNNSEKLEKLEKEITDKKKLFEENKNFQFWQFNSQTFSAIIKKLDKKSESDIFLALCQFSQKNNSVYISQETLSKLTNYSRPTVSNALKKLITEKLILRLGDSLYVLNADLVWQTGFSKKTYAHFKTTVIPSEEQIEMLTTFKNSKKTYKKAQSISTKAYF